MIQVLKTPQDFLKWRKALKNKSVGFVPTMGALHQGHQTLLNQARKENEIVILSIFVNPTQFNNQNDLSNYPKTWESDLKMAEQEKVDAIFLPQYADMYPDDYRYKITENKFSTQLCGAHRPGHFDGVLSVVMKLFQVTRPSKAYFGEKDFQQLSLIQDMVSAFFLDIEIIPVPTVREKSGLAMSSRNMRLSPEKQDLAPFIYKAMTTCQTAGEVAQSLEEKGFKVDYVEDINGRRYVAAFLGEVRLIDNVKI